jgi:hypothetical protein
LSLLSSTQLPLHMVVPRGQVKPQLTPSHVAVAPAGGMHALQAGPQAELELMGTQLALPLQRCVPVGHAHSPATHTSPRAQTVEHLLQ